jgi:hypothetical protein
MKKSGHWARRKSIPEEFWKGFLDFKEAQDIV